MSRESNSVKNHSLHYYSTAQFSLFNFLLSMKTKVCYSIIVNVALVTCFYASCIEHAQRSEVVIGPDSGCLVARRGDRYVRIRFV
jgi:hypothetical protein